MSQKRLQFKINLYSQFVSIGHFYKLWTRPQVNLLRIHLALHLKSKKLLLVHHSNSMLNLLHLNLTVTFSKSHNALSIFWMETNLKARNYIETLRVTKLSQLREVRLYLELQKSQNMMILQMRWLILQFVWIYHFVVTPLLQDLSHSFQWLRWAAIKLTLSHVDLLSLFIKQLL